MAKRFCVKNVTRLGVLCDASFAHLENVANTREIRPSIDETPLSVTFQCNGILKPRFSRERVNPRAKVGLLEKRCSRRGREQRFRGVGRRMPKEI